MLLMWLLSDCWEMYSRSAARVIFNSSATSRKYFKWRKFIAGPLVILNIILHF